MTKKIWISLIGEGGRILMAPDRIHSMRLWVEDINQNLQRSSPGKTSVVEWFGSNGNFVLNSRITDDNEIQDYFCSCTGYNAVLFDLSHIYWIIQEISSISNSNTSPWDKGVGFQLRGTKRYFEEFYIGQNRICCIERGVARVNRIIDPHPKPGFRKAEEKARIKWPRISKGLRKELDGEWTARSLPMLNGTFESALLFLSRNR